MAAGLVLGFHRPVYGIRSPQDESYIQILSHQFQTSQKRREARTAGTIHVVRSLDSFNAGSSLGRS